MMTEQTGAEEAASRGRFPLRWWSVILSLAMVAGVFASIAFAPERSYPAFSEPLETGIKVERDLTVTELTVDGLWNAYNNSIPKTVLMYNELTMRIDGVVSANVADGDGTYIVLTDPESTAAVNKVRFYLDGNLYDQTRALMGHEVLITGICHVNDAESNAPLTFTGCTLVQLVS